MTHGNPVEHEDVELTPRQSVRAEVLKIAKARRAGFREANAIGGQQGFVNLHTLERSLFEDTADRLMARRIIGRYGITRAEIISRLPSLEPADGTHPATITERMAAFLAELKIASLDLARTTHKDADWAAADDIESGMLDMFEILGAEEWSNPNSRKTERRFEVALHRPTEDNCQMHLEFLTHTALEAGLALVFRNNHKATIFDRATNDLIKVYKRSEHIQDMTSVDSEVAGRIMRLIFAGGGHNAPLTGSNFGWMAANIRGRGPAIEPVYSTLYVARAVRPTMQLATAAELDQFPILAIAIHGTENEFPPYGRSPRDPFAKPTSD